MADPQGKFQPIKKFGLTGLQTFDDPQFIDDTALAACSNMILDGNQLAPRKGTKLLYTAPAGETGSPEQLFSFTEGQGQQFLLAKYTNHWYVLDPTTDTWLLIGSQDTNSSLYNGSTWHNSYYSNDMYSKGFGSNRAFFAPSDYSVPDNDVDQVLMWGAGITHLTADAHIGDTTLAVENSEVLTFNALTQFSLGGDSILGIKGNNYQTSGLLSDGSDVITGIPTTGGIVVGSIVTGVGIPPGTTVLQILSSTSIQISNNASSPVSTLFTGVADLTNTSGTVANYTSNVVGTGTTTSGTNTIPDFTITGLNGTSAFIVGSTVVGSNVSGGTTIIDFSSNGDSTYTLTLSASSTGNGSGTYTVYNPITTTLVVTGVGIPNNTTIATLTGSPPSYTGFTISNPATATLTQATMSFLNPTPSTTLTFRESNIIVVQIQPLQNNYPAGTPIATAITKAVATVGSLPQGNTVLIWLNHLVIAADDGFVEFSIAGDPLNWGGVTAGVSGGIQGRISDMRAFGQFFLASSPDSLEIGQTIVDPASLSTGIYFTPYLSGQGMGAVSSAGTILYNNTYYYPTLSNGILALTPNFTGTSSSAGVEVLTDPIQNLFLQFTFLRGVAYNRKLYWLVQTAQTPEQSATNYWLVYDLIRKGFSLMQHSSVDGVLYLETLCLFGTDGHVYQAEYPSYEDELGGKGVGYLAEAFSKRFDFGEPTYTKASYYTMLQGTITQGTELFIDVLYNEGGSLGKVTYSITGDTAQPYFTLLNWDAIASDPLAKVTMGSGNTQAGIYRVYLSMDKSYKAHNIQFRFYTERAGSYWTVGIISPNVELSTVPLPLVISPQST